MYELSKEKITVCISSKSDAYLHTG